MLGMETARGTRRCVRRGHNYGDVAVTKEKCVGHVQKRLRKALRDLKKSMKGQKLSDGLTIG